jgi:GT2 family glycosyltransferase
MNVSVVIPTWNGKRLLEAYLPSVIEACAEYRKHRAAETEITVIEDGSKDGSIQWLAARHGDEVRAIEHDGNRGFAAACLTGFLASRHPLVLLLNNDVRLKSDCMAPMAEHFEDPDVFAVTGRLFNQKGDVFCNGGKVARFRRGMWSTYENYDLIPGVRPDLSLLSFSAIGAFSMYARNRFLELGGFDPLAAMVEDVELSYRGWKRGWTVKYEPRSIGYHDASQTMDRRYKRRALDKISRRSRILMHWMLLHDRGMFCRHLLSIAGRTLTSWLIMDWRFYWAIGTSLGHIRHVARKRRATRRTMVRSDRELLELLDHFYRTSPVALRRA